MEANKTILQMKYARIVTIFAEQTGITLEDALDFFYTSSIYQMMNEGIADCSQQTCRLGSADLLSLVATAEKVPPGTRGVMSFNSRRRLYQPIELTPSPH